MRRILLGVSGGVACYKSVELARELIRRGWEVTCVLTSSAAKMVTPLLFEAITGRKAYVDLFETGEMLHIRLEREADAIVIAPATANFLAKADLGIADDLLATILLSRSAKPLLFAPAMNREMYLNPVVQNHMQSLQEKGFMVLPVAEGSLACGEEGPGRMLEPELIADYIEYAVTPKNFQGARFLITAGPTREYLDGVRFLSNASTGKIGFEVAKYAAFSGAEVTLIHGPTHLSAPLFVKTIAVDTAKQMKKECERHLAQSDIVVMSAAVSDIRPEKSYEGKFRREDWKDRSIRFALTEDILQTLSRKKGGWILVGFAAEWGLDEPEKWKEKLERKSLDLLAVNDVSQKSAGFASERIRGLLLSPNGVLLPLQEMEKREFAQKLLEEIYKIWKERRRER